MQDEYEHTIQWHVYAFCASLLAPRSRLVGTLGVTEESYDWSYTRFSHVLSRCFSLNLVFFAPRLFVIRLFIDTLPPTCSFQLQQKFPT